MIMKPLQRQVISLVLILSVLFSCEEQPRLAAVDRLQQLTKQSLMSEDFKSLNVSLSGLNYEASAFINANENSIFIPFYGSDNRRGIIALFNDANVLRSMVEYEVITDVAVEDIYSSLISKTFAGRFHFRTPEGEIELMTERSRVVSSVVRRVSSGRVSDCNYITESGGALDCAGSRIENMNWFKKTLCYIDFLPCLIEESISCWIDGCS